MSYRRRPPPKERRVHALRKMRKGIRPAAPKGALDMERAVIGSSAEGYQVILEPPGAGYRHILTERDIRRRLDRLPARLLVNLRSVYLPRMTKKRRGMSCLGLCDYDTGAIYLYPVEEGLTWELGHLSTSLVSEYKKFGAKISSTTHGTVVEWTERALKGYFSDNVLIHELGHTLDWWNGSYRQRERWAEHFANYWGAR